VKNDLLTQWQCGSKPYTGQDTQNNVYLLRAINVLLTVHTGDFRDVPMSIPTTTDGWDVPLYKACSALVPHERVDLIPLPLFTKGSCVLHQRGLVTGH